MRVTLPGIASRFPPRRGTQKLWMTSVLAISRLTGRPAGRWRSVAVTMPSSGDRDSHHHRGPAPSVRRAPRPGGGGGAGRGDDAELRVPELPPPLVPDHLDAEGVLRRSGLRPEDCRHGREGDERQNDRREEGRG